MEKRDCRANLSGNKSHIGKSQKSWIIKKSTILIGVLCIIMILPDDVFGWVTLYQSTTPSSISYRWLKYNFGIIQLLMLFVGIYYGISLKKKWFLFLSIIMMIREFFYLIVSENSVFRASAYEMYLSLLVGYAFLLWVEGGLKTRDNCEKYFKCFLVSNILTIYINVAMGGAGGVLAGRYHASNLDVGGTGEVCAICIIYIFISTEIKWYDYVIAVLSIIGLFLSGSRANLVFLFILMGVYFTLQFISRKNNKKKEGQKKKFLNRLILGVLVLLIIGVLFVINIGRIEAWLLRSRFTSLLDLEGIQYDSSVLGRTASLKAGLDVLKSHPFGISGYFINLQQEVRQRGYPTFPHSTLLSMYLLFGPLVLSLYGYWFLLLRKMRRIGSKYFYILLYLLMCTTIYGGPITNFKSVFIFGVITMLAHWQIRENTSH